MGCVLDYLQFLYCQLYCLGKSDNDSSPWWGYRFKGHVGLNISQYSLQTDIKTLEPLWKWDELWYMLCCTTGPAIVLILEFCLISFILFAPPARGSFLICCTSFSHADDYLWQLPQTTWHVSIQNSSCEEPWTHKKWLVELVCLTSKTY